jgi:hypothetical protein
VPVADPTREGHGTDFDIGVSLLTAFDPYQRVKNFKIGRNWLSTGPPTQKRIHDLARIR